MPGFPTAHFKSCLCFLGTLHPEIITWLIIPQACVEYLLCAVHCITVCPVHNASLVWSQILIKTSPVTRKISNVTKAKEETYKEDRVTEALTCPQVSDKVSLRV